MTTSRRSTRVLLIVVGLLIAVPIVEIAVLVAVGQAIGIWPTLLLMLTTSGLGAYLLRREGGKAWRAFQEDLTAGRPPGTTATDGLLVLFGGVFMLVPGFASDLIGLFMIAPPTRRLARAAVLAVFIRRISPVVASTLFGPKRVRVWVDPDTQESGSAPLTGDIIEPDSKPER